MDLPCSSEGKETACNAGDPGSIPGQEDPLEKGPAIHPSILAWRIPWIEEPGGPQSMVLQRVRHDQATDTETSTVEHGTFLSTKSDISPDCADDK